MNLLIEKNIWLRQTRFVPPRHFMYLSIVFTRVRRAGNPREIDRLLLPEGRTFDENIFSKGGKIEHTRADLTFFSNKCYRGFILNETRHQAKAC